MRLSTKKIVVVAYLQISFIDIYVKTYKQCSNALFVKAYNQCSNALFVKAYKQCSNVLAFMSKRYKQCSNALFVKALQTLQTLHIFESQARVRV